MEGFPGEGGDVSQSFNLSMSQCTNLVARAASGQLWQEANRQRQMQGAFDMTFGNFTSDQHFEGFDFDSFLQNDSFDPDQLTFDNGPEAIGGT